MFDFLFGPFKLLMKDLPFIWVSCCLFPLHSVHSQVPWTALETCWVEVCGFLPDFSPALSHPSRRAAHTKRHRVHHFATASNFFQARSVAGLLERLSSSSPQPACKPAHSPPLPLDEQLCFSNHRNFSNRVAAFILPQKGNARQWQLSGKMFISPTEQSFTSALLSVLGEDADVKFLGWGLI